MVKTLKEADKKQNIEKVLIENFVALQKVMVQLSGRFDELSNKISKLLDLFEISAKTLSEGETGENRKLSEKVDTLLSQNKTLAKGLALMYEKMPSGSAMPEMQRFKPPQYPRPEQEKPVQKAEISGEYQKSISVGSSNFSPEEKFRPKKR